MGGTASHDKVLCEWLTPQEFLDLVEPMRSRASYRFFYENEYKPIREGWVLCKYARLAFSNRQYKIRIFDEQFPDGQLNFIENGEERVIDYEITQAFRPPDELAKSKLPGNGGADPVEVEELFIESLRSSLTKKAEKHYSVPINLLVYVTNISTWGGFYDIIEAHHKDFEPFRESFKSVSILGTSAVRAVQLFPEFKEY